MVDGNEDVKTPKQIPSLKALEKAANKGAGKREKILKERHEATGTREGALNQLGKDAIYLKGWASRSLAEIKEELLQYGSLHTNWVYKSFRYHSEISRDDIDNDSNWSKLRTELVSSGFPELQIDYKEQVAEQLGFGVAILSLPRQTIICLSIGLGDRFRQ